MMRPIGAIGAGSPLVAAVPPTVDDVPRNEPALVIPAPRAFIDRPALGPARTSATAADIVADVMRITGRNGPRRDRLQGMRRIRHRLLGRQRRISQSQPWRRYCQTKKN